MRLAGFLDFFKPKFVPVAAADEATIEELDTFYREREEKYHDMHLEIWGVLERQKEEMKAFSVREKMMWREIKNRYNLPEHVMAHSFDRESKKLGYYK